MNPWEQYAQPDAGVAATNPKPWEQFSTPASKTKLPSEADILKTFASIPVQSKEQLLKAGQSIEPNEALVSPTVDPLMAIGMGLKATAGGANRFTAGAMGEVAGSMGAEGAVQGIDALTKGNFAEEHPTITGGLKLAAGVAGGYAGGRLEGTPTVDGEEILNNLKKANPNTTIKSAVKNYAERKGITDVELKSMLDGIPIEKQAETVANYTKESGTGLFKQVLGGSDDRITEFHRRAQKRVKDIEKVANTGNIKELDTVASKNFGEMVNEVRGMDLLVDSKDILRGIDTATILGGKDDTAKNMINSMDEIFKAKPNQNLSDLLLMREELNSVLRTAKGTSKYILGTAKTNLDNIIKEGTPKEIDKLVKTTVSDYANAKQNLKMADMIESSKNMDGIINYKALRDKLVEEGDINTYQSKAVVNILEQFDKKFNNDYRVLGGTKGDDTKEGLLGLHSEIVSPLKALFIRWGEYGNNIAMQKLIAKSLDTSKTPYSFASKIREDKTVPREIREIFNENMKAAKNAASEVDRPIIDIAIDKGIDKGIERGLRKSERTLAEKSLAIDRIKTTNYSNQEKVYELQDLLEERLANDLPTGNVEKRLAIARNRLKESNESLRITKDKHSEMSAKFDEELKNSGYTIDNKGNYNPPKKPSTRSEVKGKQPSAEKPSVVEVDITKKIGSTKKKPFNALMEAKKNASEVPIGGSEDEARQAVINLSKKPLGADVRFKNMSKSAIAEIQLQKEIDDDVKEAMDMFGGSYEEALSAVLKERGLR